MHRINHLLDLSEKRLEQHDFNHFVDLDRSRRSVATLAAATRGDLGLSERHRSVYVRRGLHDELRLVARSGTTTWAMACLVRTSDLPLFTADESRFPAAIARHICDGLRATLAARTPRLSPGWRCRRRATHHTVAGPPGCACAWPMGAGSLFTLTFLSATPPTTAVSRSCSSRPPPLRCFPCYSPCFVLFGSTVDTKA